MFYSKKIFNLLSTSVVEVINLCIFHCSECNTLTIDFIRHMGDSDVVPIRVVKQLSMYEEECGTQRDASTTTYLFQVYQ